MFEHENGRKDFIAYTVSRAITHMRGATPQEHQSAVTSAITLANMLELDGTAPWPRKTYTLPPRAEQQAATAPVVQTQPAAAPAQEGNPHAADNVAKLLANIPQAAPQGPSVGTGAVVGGNGGPPQGTPSNPATSGAVIAAHGEVQGQREVVVGPTVSPSGIVSDVQAVRQPGVVGPQ